MTAPALVRLSLPGRIHTLLDGTGDTDTAVLHTVLGALIDGPGVADHLRALLRDPGELVRVAGSSYWHANGFAKLVLHRADGFALRLHVWPGAQPDVMPQLGELEPHSHRWDFASTVLAGALTVLESEESGDGSGLNYVRCTYDGLNVEPSVPTSLRPVDGYVVEQGERYVTDTSVIHTVHPHPGTTVATLLLQGPHRRASTEVYRVPGAPGLPPARPISADEVGELLAEVVGAAGFR